MNRIFDVHIRIHDGGFPVADTCVERMVQMRLQEKQSGGDWCVSCAYPLHPDPVGKCFEEICKAVKALLDDDNKMEETK